MSLHSQNSSQGLRIRATLFCEKLHLPLSQHVRCVSILAEGEGFGQESVKSMVATLPAFLPLTTLARLSSASLPTCLRLSHPYARCAGTVLPLRSSHCVRFAEGEGFEPSKVLPLLDFESSAFDLSATPPYSIVVPRTHG